MAPTTPHLRPYQHRFITEVYDCIRAGSKRILGVAPTGSGKTIIASQIVEHAVSRGRRVLFIIHRDILISQTFEKFQSFGVECGFIKAGWQENRESLVQIASVQTLPRRNWWHEFPANVIMLDECHILGWSSVVQQMMSEIYPDAVYIGLTATPYRLNRRESMGDVFDALVSAPTPRELIESGHLVKPSYYGVKAPELGRVKIVDGDFDEEQLALICDRPELIAQLICEWKRLAWGRRTIVFAVSVLHSQHICEAFQQQGISAAHVDGNTPTKARNQIYQQLAEGEIQVLSSCQALTEGFDVCAVSAIALCRPTKSKALYLQMVGRGLRLSSETEKIDCIVLDQAGNVDRHGFVEDLEQISLANGNSSSKTGVAPTKLCPTADGGCSVLLYTFQMVCPQCGYRFPGLEQLPLIQQLEQLLPEGDLEKLKFYRGKILEAYRKEFSPGWAAVIFKEQFGYWPPDDWARGAIFGDKPTSEQAGLYYDYLQAIAQRKQKPESWVQRNLMLEYGSLEH